MIIAIKQDETVAKAALSAFCSSIPLSRCSVGNEAGVGHPFAADSAEFLESSQDTGGGKPSPR